MSTAVAAPVASGNRSSVSGGGGRVEDQGNEAAGDFSTVSRGRSVTVQDEGGHAP
ncbi:MAG: hypothetical protein O7J95_00260 [Planctomycetota bacterium]|nr:hypothetical protein [Planctomycetota bacterium]